MSIEHIFITNLPRRPERKYLCLGALASYGYPISGDTTTFTKTHDSHDYKTANDVKDAAANDGFKSFKRIRTLERVALPNEVSGLAWHWTWCAGLRDIVNVGKPALYLVDDWIPTIPWREMCSIADEVYDDRFLGIQLSLEVIAPRKLYEFNIEQYSARLGRGFVQTNDHGFVLSPKGARLLLSRVDATPWLSPYSIVGELARCGRTKGIYHTRQSVIEHACKWKKDWKRNA